MILHDPVIKYLLHIRGMHKLPTIKSFLDLVSLWAFIQILHSVVGFPHLELILLQ